jgi:hypothetical protein
MAVEVMVAKNHLKMKTLKTKNLKVKTHQMFLVNLVLLNNQKKINKVQKSRTKKTKKSLKVQRRGV